MLVGEKNRPSNNNVKNMKTCDMLPPMVDTFCCNRKRLCFLFSLVKSVRLSWATLKAT